MPTDTMFTCCYACPCGTRIALELDTNPAADYYPRILLACPLCFQTFYLSDTPALPPCRVVRVVAHAPCMAAPPRLTPPIEPPLPP